MKTICQNGVFVIYKKKTENRMKKGKNIEEPSNFKLDCPNCYK